MCASSTNMRTNFGSAASAGRIRFSTTGFWNPCSPLCRARKISAIPPWAILLTTWYRVALAIAPENTHTRPPEASNGDRRTDRGQLPGPRRKTRNPAHRLVGDLVRPLPDVRAHLRRSVRAPCRRGVREDRHRRAVRAGRQVRDPVDPDADGVSRSDPGVRAPGPAPGLGPRRADR